MLMWEPMSLYLNKNLQKNYIKLGSPKFKFVCDNVTSSLFKVKSEDFEVQLVKEIGSYNFTFDNLQVFVNGYYINLKDFKIWYIGNN